MTFTPPTWDGNVSSRNWSWTGRVTCTESHPDYTQWSCLQSSPTNGLVIGWTTEWCSDVHYWAGPGRSFAWSYIPWSFTSCTPQYWYRATGYGSAGNGGAHWSLPGTSASVIACPV